MSPQDDPPLEVALRNLIHAEKLIAKILTARGCDDPDAVIADAIWTRAAERLCDLERAGAVQMLEPANDRDRPLYGEDLCD